MTRSSVRIPEWMATLAETAPRMPVHPMMRPPARGGRESAVLVLFGETELGPDVLLIQRNTGLRRHSGQPAFPGGATDPTDGGPVDCALREAEEETGVVREGVMVLGTLPELYIPHTSFRVTPVLGWWHSPSDVRPVDTGEVASVSRVPVAELADPGNRLRVRHPDGRTSPAFQVRDMLVWGFTAGILDQLLVLGGWEQPWLDGTEEVVDAVAYLARDGGGAP